MSLCPRLVFVRPCSYTAMRGRAARAGRRAWKHESRTSSIDPAERGSREKANTVAVDVGGAERPRTGHALASWAYVVRQSCRIPNCYSAQSLIACNSEFLCTLWERSTRDRSFLGVSRRPCPIETCEPRRRVRPRPFRLAPRVPFFPPARGMSFGRPPSLSGGFSVSPPVSM